MSSYNIGNYLIKRQSERVYNNRQIFHAFLFSIRNYSAALINIQRREAELNIILPRVNNFGHTGKLRPGNQDPISRTRYPVSQYDQVGPANRDPKIFKWDPGIFKWDP